MVIHDILDYSINNVKNNYMKTIENKKLKISPEQRDPSVWVCYMFGNKPNGDGMTYIPQRGSVPNFFVRWMMKICFACTWIKTH